MPTAGTTVTVLWALATALVGLAVGWALGRRGRRPGPRRGEPSPVAADAEEDRRPAVEEGGEAGAPPLGTLESRRPRREQVKEEALRVALGRIAAFLHDGVRAPLEAARDAGPSDLRAAADRAVGAVEDLEFFLREPLADVRPRNVVPLLQQVGREFVEDWDVAVRFSTERPTVMARANPDGLMDAVYLLLHNAAVFGEGSRIDLGVSDEEGWTRIDVCDRGPGFTEEALERAHDLFYTTTPSGLGLGIPFARRVVEGFGGELRLHNRPEGGARVTIRLPGA